MLFQKKPYKVTLQGRAGLTYRENVKTLFVDSELLGGPNFDIVIYTDSIRAWDPPHDSGPLTAAEKGRIKQNISEALKRMKIDWA